MCARSIAMWLSFWELQTFALLYATLKCPVYTQYWFLLWTLCVRLLKCIHFFFLLLDLSSVSFVPSYNKFVGSCAYTKRVFCLRITAAVTGCRSDACFLHAHIWLLWCATNPHCILVISSRLMIPNIPCISGSFSKSVIFSYKWIVDTWIFNLLISNIEF